MALIDFYEKPGCINNSRQKRILEAAGHQLRCHNLLEEAWTVERLRPFLRSEDPQEILNSTAPAIKRGDLDPTALSFEGALQLMVADPILVRRPLIAVGGLQLQGFDDARLSPYLGTWSGAEDVVTCPNLQTTPCSGS
nr:ArsC/Spx/MgsR family protein [uncultured Holophaga sp.]